MNIPYYIYAPAWTYKSSGVKVMHLLCHLLNKTGCKAYIYPVNQQGAATHPDLDTSLIKPEHHNYYIGNGIDPIAVYPDVVQGNPLQAKRVVRYLLAPAGKYGGDSTFPASDKVWAYTTPIAQAVGSDKVLLITTPDLSLIESIPATGTKSGDCFYAHKYDRIHGQKLLPITDGMQRLEGRPEQIISILRKRKRCFIYEMTEVALLAELCGCEVVFVRTPYFNSIPPELEFNYFSSRWSDEFEGPVPVDLAGMAYKHHQSLHQKTEVQLQQFIKETQSWE